MPVDRGMEAVSSPAVTSSVPVVPEDREAVKSPCSSTVAAAPRTSKVSASVESSTSCRCHRAETERGTASPSERVSAVSASPPSRATKRLSGVSMTVMGALPEMEPERACTSYSPAVSGRRR